MPVIVALGWTIIFSQLSFGSLTMDILAVGCCVGSAICCIRCQNRIALHLACITLGVLGASRLHSENVPYSEHFGISMPVRVDGYVTQVRRVNPHVRRFVINGETDAALLPCVRTTSLVIEFVKDSTATILEVGERRVVFGTLRRPQPATLPGEVSELDICRALGVSFVIERARSTVTHETSMLNRVLSASRVWITKTLQETLSEKGAAVALALVLGDRGGIDVESRRAYAASGTAHMFSVSGSHVGIILMIMLMALGVTPSWWRLAVTAFAITFFVALSGWDPPAMRAGIVGIMALCGRRFEQTIDLGNLLAGAILIMICVDPDVIRSPGAILSVAAMTSIITLAPIWKNRLVQWLGRERVWKNAFASSLSISMAASLGVGLPSMVFFDVLSLTSPVANLMVVPLLSLAMILSILLLPGSVCNFTLPIAWCCEKCIEGADLIAKMMADESMVSMSEYGRWAVAGMFLLVAVWPLCSRSFVSFMVRQLVGIVLLMMIVRIIPTSRIYQHLAERRYGSAIIARHTDTLLILLTGEKNAPPDQGLRSWCRAQHVHIRCEGIGIWGVRTSALVRSDIVGRR